MRFLQKKSNTVEAFLSFIADVVARAGFEIGTITTDEDSEFDGRFQEEIGKLEIYHELTPPGTPQYNGVVERALGLLMETSVAMLKTVEEGYSTKLWEEAMSIACDISSVSVTTENEDGVPPFQKWHGAPCSLDGI